MFIVIIIIALTMIVIGAICESTRASDCGAFLEGIGACFLVIAVVASVVCGVKLTKMGAVKKQIEIHESENAEIEQEIAELVSNYQKHEQNTFEGLKPESVMVALSLYPELKSDALVQAQIEIYTQNRKDIIALKDELTKKGFYAWWLYFGKGE